ncbi:hypothetical protein OG992_33720 [Micromonospora sp. NBC_00362]|uniref:hypothetical protein n=1 Tax=Micromonospora sp. NBC_00362 TaxID=2975975 RepID=UPI00224FB161|nr:hypothetical protein [Micromonospora sp. NBC_00362]MCX5122116.1 hypothetical protein [Micromonospora sp. NBC_00362]
MHFDGGEHQMVGLAGASVRLPSEARGADQVVLTEHLMSSPDFTVIDGLPAPDVQPFGLLDALPEDVLAAAKQWERHIVEVETGLPPHAPLNTTPRPEYDPAKHSLAERQRAKARSWASATAPSKTGSCATPLKDCGG